MGPQTSPLDKPVNGTTNLLLIKQLMGPQTSYCFIKRGRFVVPSTALSRGEVWGHINCFIKRRRFVVPLTA
jgi:hypothetical protein